MAVTDHHDIFIGSTDDGWTFLVVNRPIRNAARILTGAGFTTRTLEGRTLYLLPPETAEDAHERAGIAAYGLMAHTMDLVDLAWTTRHASADGAPYEAVVRFHDGTVTATARTDRASEVLAQNGFAPAEASREYTLPAGLSEHDAVNALVRAETHLHSCGIPVRVGLGIPTVQDIPPPSSRPAATPTPLPPDQTRHRRRHR
ncbi:hypothetical protein [Streptomyces griseiscabiei]|uniref:Uncharacterized protein n=1 Tax=Streptomyces griseiscabiei TaxID=2993540 RepID=A0ABU4KXM6_9ACTN|nr:hypothetical protein [Streptomyces griseiscabiei]MBZ3904411.1 hypothetical protein [Streptomyces griseiscabiei]MDX2908158.1 hypothetical protein [Streptomyces griseiscabiei]